MNRILAFLFSFVALPLMAANPAFTDFNTNQFITTGNKVSIKVTPTITNAVAIAPGANVSVATNSPQSFTISASPASNTVQIIPGTAITVQTNTPGQAYTLSTPALTNNEAREVNFAGPTTTIGGRLLSTNLISKGGTNVISGSLHIGTIYYSDPTDELLTLYGIVTNSQAFDQVEMVSEWVYTTNHNGVHAGLSVQTGPGVGNTGNWTNISYPSLSTIEATFQPDNNSSGVINKAAAFSANVAGAQTSGTAINEMAMYSGDSANGGGGAMRRLVGLKISGLEKGGTNTGVWLGISQTNLVSDGNWSIDDHTGYPARFSTNLSVGGSFQGDASGVSNSVDIISGTGLTIVSNANKRSFTLSTANGVGFWYTNPAYATPSISNTFDVGMIGRLSIGSTGSTNKLNVVAGQLGTNQEAFTVTGTIPNGDVNGDYHGNSITMTGKGSEAYENTALYVGLLAGYTGPWFSVASESQNISAGTGNDVWGFSSGNFGVSGSSEGITAGHNVGVWGFAQRSSTLNIGLLGQSPNAASSAKTNIGVAGTALNAANVNIGGFFGLMNSAPSILSSAALIADNGVVASPIFVAMDNGTEVFRIADGGNVGIGVSSPIQKLQVDGSVILGTNSFIAGGGSPGDTFSLWGSVDDPVGTSLSIRSGTIYGNAAGMSNAVTLIASGCVQITTNADGRTFTISISGSGADVLTNNRAAATLIGLTLTGPTTNTSQSVPNWYGGLWGTNPATGNQWMLTNGTVVVSASNNLPTGVLGIQLSNTVPSTAGNPKASPYIQFDANGNNTTGGTNSTVHFTLGATATSDSTAAGRFSISNSVGTGAATEVFGATTAVALFPGTVSAGGSVTLSNLLTIAPIGSTTTNAGMATIWNSNNFGMYIRGTNGVDKPLATWP